ncbi:c-type cytochrome [Betaproteobacteria bacterium SCN2]|nr:c-type cytochrome [Betaproteobacteria bacterium SCN2]
MRTARILAGFGLAALLSVPASAADSQSREMVERGRYLIATSGCNDCHTPGYMQKDGHVPESEWLTGDSMGWQGPWGTTYAANLRLSIGQLTERQWLARARGSFRPPMPGPSLHAMTDADLRAIYRYVKSLPMKGGPAPTYVPPGGPVATPYFDFTPKNLPRQAAAQ